MNWKNIYLNLHCVDLFPLTVYYNARYGTYKISSQRLWNRIFSFYFVYDHGLYASLTTCLSACCWIITRIKRSECEADHSPPSNAQANSMLILSPPQNTTSSLDDEKEEGSSQWHHFEPYRAAHFDKLITNLQQKLTRFTPFQNWAIFPPES